MLKTDIMKTTAVSPDGAQTEHLVVPFALWLVAFIGGLGVAAGSLSYSPDGRINILWVWLLWAGLPLLGTLVAVCFAAFGSARPWLFQWRNRAVAWHPTHRQRLQMLWLLQALWCVLALGMLCGYWTLLLFSDLAFGWSSTLVQDPALIAAVAEALALPWQAIWPAAVPAPDMVAATQFQRIAPAAAEPFLATQWWQFLMASLIFYNLLPRAVLALLFYVRWHRAEPVTLQVRAPIASVRDSSSTPTLTESPSSAWQDAVRVSWELEGAAAQSRFGLHGWTEDEQAMARVLEQHPKRILWQVDATRSPVGELADLVAQAAAGGVQTQALWAHCNADTDPERHLLSWRAFASRQQLTWITDD